jgi:hypothetical protein
MKSRTSCNIHKAILYHFELTRHAARHAARRLGKEPEVEEEETVGRASALRRAEPS